MKDVPFAAKTCLPCRRVSQAVGDGGPGGAGAAADPSARASIESSPKALRALSIKEEKRKEKRESCTAAAAVAADTGSTGSGSGTGSLAPLEGDDAEEAPGHGVRRGSRPLKRHPLGRSGKVSLGHCSDGFG